MPPQAPVRAELVSRVGDLARDRDRWFRAFLVTAAMVMLTGAVAAWAVLRGEYRPFLIIVDELGQSRAVLTPITIKDWPDAAVRREVADFVRDWRSVSTDQAVMLGRLRRIQYFLQPNSAANAKILEWAADPATDPMKTAEAATIDVQVSSVVSLGGRSWLAEWTETRRARSSGAVQTVQAYRGTFVLDQRRTSDELWLMQNPFGMVVEDIDVVVRRGP